MNTKQRLFVELYLTLWNATEAARQAGYAAKNADVQGPRMLGNVGIRRAIEHRLADKQATADEVLVRLTDHARGSMDDFIGSMDRIDLDKARAAGKMHLIKKIKQRTTTISKSEGEDIETHEIELELYDAQAATVQLGRALGVFHDHVTIEHTWRDQVKQAGVDPDRYFAVIVENAVKQLSAPAAPQEAAIDDATQLADPH